MTEEETGEEENEGETRGQRCEEAEERNATEGKEREMEKDEKRHQSNTNQ